MPHIRPHPGLALNLRCHLGCVWDEFEMRLRCVSDDFEMNLGLECMERDCSHPRWDPKSRTYFDFKMEFRMVCADFFVTQSVTNEINYHFKKNNTSTWSVVQLVRIPKPILAFSCRALMLFMRIELEKRWDGTGMR